MTLVNGRHVDAAPRGRVPAVLAITAGLTGLLWVLGGGNFAIWAIIAGAATGVLVTGVRPWKSTADPNVMQRYWIRPQWLRWGVTGVTGVLAVLALLTGVGEGVDAPATWPVAAIIWAALPIGAGLYAWRGHTHGRDDDRQLSTGQAVLARISRDHFDAAGLTKKQTGGNILAPQIIRTGTDALGNPYYVAQLLAGIQTPPDWEKAGPRLASAWAVPEVTVNAEGINEVRVTAVLERFTRTGPVPWRPADATLPVVDYLKALPMGELSRSPEPWFQSLVEAQLTVGGVPGAGKSVYLSDLLAHLSRHPHIDIAMCDLKMGVEAEPWRERLSAVAATQDDGVQLLAWLLEQCKERYDQMRTVGIRNAWKGGFLGADNHVRVLVIDEAAELFSGATKAARQAAEQAIELTRSLVAIGRAAGYVVILATQKPTSDTLPSAIRDLTPVRVAFACKTDPAAASILGSDWFGSTGDQSPLAITRDERGTAIVGTDAGEFVRVQSAYISDDEIDQIVADTARFRTPWNWQAADDEPVLMDEADTAGITGSAQQPAQQPQRPDPAPTYPTAPEQPQQPAQAPQQPEPVKERRQIPPPPRPDDGWKF